MSRYGCLTIWIFLTIGNQTKKRVWSREWMYYDCASRALETLHKDNVTLGGTQKYSFGAEWKENLT